MAITKFYADANHPKAQKTDVICGDGSPLYGYTETTYEGAVLETRERNYYDDSDFYAIVWDEAAQTVKEVEYASTRGWTYLNGADVDATDEVREKAAAWYAERAFNMLQAQNEAQAKHPAVKGKLVKVVKGRPTFSVKGGGKGEPVAQGTTGLVFWVGKQATYTRYTRPQDRVGVRTSDGQTFFTAASNVEVIGYEQYLHEEEALRERAQNNGAAIYRGAVAASMRLAYL